MKNTLKRFLPARMLQLIRSIFHFYKRKYIQHIFSVMYRKDMLHYLKYSRTFGNDNATKLIGTIILQYHVIEKGLTMPQTRLGFGKVLIYSLCKSCIDYIDLYDKNNDQVNHAIGVILEYKDFHTKNDYCLDEELLKLIEKLQFKKSNICNTTQKAITKSAYFEQVRNDFKNFSSSRTSVRNYTNEDLPIGKIINALEIAKTAPSACNRQSWRTYIFTDKVKICSILEFQGGNRGFGHLTNKLIIVAGELGVFSSTNERNQVYIDGGIYCMNLLYGLHYNEIGACILNCSFDYHKEQKIKRFCNIKESEVLIAMISCGIPPDEFFIACSPRTDVIKTNTIL